MYVNWKGRYNVLQSTLKATEWFVMKILYMCTLYLPFLCCIYCDKLFSKNPSKRVYRHPVPYLIDGFTDTLYPIRWVYRHPVPYLIDVFTDNQYHVQLTLCNSSSQSITQAFSIDQSIDQNIQFLTS